MKQKPPEPQGAPRWARLGSTLLLALTTACASAAGPPDPALTPMPAGFLLRPGDMVRVRVWKEADLTADYGVDEHGEVNIPGLGRLSVLTLPRDSLQDRLVRAYATSLKEPGVTVTLLRRIAVTGAVRNPGMYAADATTTVGELLALAGGPSVDGRSDVLQVVRDGRVRYANVQPTLFVGQLALQPGDQLIVPLRRWTQYETLLGTQVLSLVVVTVLSILQLRR